MRATASALALIADGEITIGQMYPIGGVAVATDGHNSLAMLRQRPGESLLEIMLRLDEAVKKAIETAVYTPTKSTRQLRLRQSVDNAFSA